MTEHPAWPSLPWDEWADTCTTVHLWTQVMGKVRVARAPWLNHSWHVPLYLTSRGMTTSTMPLGHGSLQLDLDLVGHRFSATTDRGAVAEFALEPMPVADFYGRVMDALESVGAPTSIHLRPNEVESPVPFPEDRQHGSYDAAYVERFFRVLTTVDGILKRFRSRFQGKCSPVHFFWGSFDLAVTRFTGREAPEHPGGLPNLPDWITREAYSHEVSSAGFWPGGTAYPAPVFYSYAYPTPEGMADRRVRPSAAGWNSELGEFVLEYDAVRTADDPDGTLMSFLQDTWEAAAESGGWDRSRLEWDATRVPERYRPD